MNKKIVLTSVIAIAFAMPAMAAPQNSSNTFPEEGLMIEDYTYRNQATYTNMDGVDSGEVDAIAEYEWDTITVDPGEYIPANSTSTAPCTAGNFCLGITEDLQNRTPHYDATNAQGLTACSTLDNGNFPNSAEGASANTDCYRACDIANMGQNGSIATIAHAATLTGNDYYGAGTDTCEPATCVRGYHVKPGGAPDLNTEIGTVTGSGNGSGTTFAVTYSGKGTITGKAQCSTRGVEDERAFESSDHFTTTLPDSTGPYCYCQLDGWTPESGGNMSISTLWVFNPDGGNVQECADNCADYCAYYLRGDDEDNQLPFRAAVFGSVTPLLASCEANTITINWTGASQASIDANNAGQCTYDGDINTPQSATPVTGKSFKGWRFHNPNNNQ